MAIDTSRGASVSRRGFVEGAGALGIGALAGYAAAQAGTATPRAAVAAESSAADAGKASGGKATGDATAGVSPWAQINPQDTDYMTNSVDDFSQTVLAQPLAIGSVTMRNRLLKSSATSGVANDPTAGVAYYEQIAKGGIGGVFVEGSYALFEHLDTPEHVVVEGGDTRLTIDTSPLAQIAEAVHRHDVPVFIQIKTKTPGIEYQWANIPADGVSTGKASELSLDDIRLYEQDCATAAQKLQAIGFDGVEINAAGDNLPASFMSRWMNDRTDEYDASSIENRTRLLNETIAAIKGTCGADFPVQVLINGIEDNDQNIGQSSLLSSVEEVAAMAEAIEAAGADSFEVRLGVFGNHDAQFMNDGYFGGYGIDGTNSFGTFFDFSRHFGGVLDGSHSGCGLMLNAAKIVKEHVSVPVGAVTYMDPAHAPDLFVNAVESGMVDFLFMNRPIANADQDYPSKLFDNRIDEIRPCCHCLHCAFDANNHLGILEGCRVNPCKGRAFGDQMPEGYDVPAGDGDKNVMVIGGGPAGMEAARVCAERGYTVSLYEKDALGGLLTCAHAIKGEHENLGQLTNYLSHMLDVRGVSVTKGQEVDASFVREQNPDVVIVATGGVQPDLGVAGTSATPVLTVQELAGASLGDSVVVAGFNARALDTALYLIAHNKRVTIVANEEEANLGKGQSRAMLSFVLPALYATGCRVMPMSTISAIGDGSVTVTSAAGVDVTVDASAVVNATDLVADTSLADALSADYQVYAVGDCADPWDIQTAIATANLTARAC